VEKNVFTYKKWDKAAPPEKILIIRLHAIGDAALSIPASNSLRKLFPSARIDFLTGELSAPLLNSLAIFDNIYAFKDYSGFDSTENSLKMKFDKLKEIKKWGTALKKNNYDVVIDLQNNRVSRMLRFFMSANYYAEFDRLSKNSASTRTLNTFHSAGFKEVINDFKLNIDTEQLSKAKSLLFNKGWNGKSRLVVLNPAGLWITRNWPIENYTKLAEIISKEGDPNFLLIGDERIKEKAKVLEERLGKKVINLAGKTSLDEIPGIFQLVNFTVTEDSALLHISWALGVPTLALLGSTMSGWTSPAPPHGASLNSTDLECGDCMQELCKYGDVHCLTRYTPETVYEKMKQVTAHL
jgi:ADP-heptose:LPS heptosyltransferase